VRYVDEYREPELLRGLAQAIRETGVSGKRLMEVCGTHTMAAARFGLRSLLEGTVRLSSGPGCPVCVTPQKDIDRFLAIGFAHGAILTSFGDMLRVPGSESSLEEARAQGVDVRIVYSCMDAVDLACETDREVVLFGVGFETTAPGVGVAVVEAQKRGLRNFSVLAAHKTMPAALEALASSDIEVHGFILPGHVSAIIGAGAYEFLPERYGMPCVISGFEPADMLQAVKVLLEQIKSQQPKVEIQYSRAVSREGNRAAQAVLNRVFEPCDAVWRGLGMIEGSGLRLRDEFAQFDAAKRFDVEVPDRPEPAGCLCGQVLAGRVDPPDCSLFGEACTPEHPVGACMVSSEGACAAWYRYRG
jgi:hydrogenase expression/formation protein HypD